MTHQEIRAHILLKGKTMSRLALEIGTTRQNVYSIVSGRTKSPHWQQKIAKAIGKPVEEVFPSAKESA